MAMKPGSAARLRRVEGADRPQLAAVPDEDADVLMRVAPDEDSLDAAAPISAEDAAAPRRRRPARQPERDHRVTQQPAFVLHSYPYKETSLLVEIFSRDHGRVAMVAKGAKRPHSRLRGVLQTFQPLALDWSGKSEVRNLINAEWIGGLHPLEKSALLSGFYLNELLVKLLARDDPHPELFSHYIATLNQLAHGEPAPIVLRKFERALLRETGVSGDYVTDAETGAPVHPDRIYVVDPEHGPRLARPSDAVPRVSGKTLLDMESEDYSDPTTQTQSKFLMRYLVAHHLGGVSLNTRQILIDLMQL